MLDVSTTRPCGPKAVRSRGPLRGRRQAVVDDSPNKTHKIHAVVFLCSAGPLLKLPSSRKGMPTAQSASENLARPQAMRKSVTWRAVAVFMQCAPRRQPSPPA